MRSIAAGRSPFPVQQDPLLTKAKITTRVAIAR